MFLCLFLYPVVSLPLILSLFSLLFSLHWHVVRRQHFQTSHLKSLGQLKPNFIWSLRGLRGKKVCSNGHGHMTCQDISKFSSLKPTGRISMLLKLSIRHRALVCSNDDSRLTFDLFTQMSTLVPYKCICMGKGLLKNY